MLERFDTVKKQLSELAAVLNEFKSEAVQLRIVELVLGGNPTERAGGQSTETRDRAKAHSHSAPKKKRGAAGKAAKKAPSRVGAVATLTELASGDFFKKSRTINDIIEHCKHNKARTFKANEFSGKLARMVRNGELVREKNADNQYEYKKP